ncbi:MAG: hypothetical protein AAF438_19735, partial [Pseudomonadota bacterium]
VEEDRVVAVLESLASRYPKNSRVQLFKYQYISVHYPDHPDLASILQNAEVISAPAGWIYQARIVEASETNDVASMYEHAKTWLQNDRARRDVNQIKSLFSTPAPKPGDTGD